MRIFITGGTGLVGSNLIKTLQSQGHEISVLTRNIPKALKKLGREVNYISSLDALRSLDGYQAVVNLAGEPIIGKRWTKKQKERLCNSRWSLTCRLTELIKLSEVPPSVFVSGSAVGYYGAQGDGVLTETSDPRENFTFELCKKWEALAIAAHSSKTRVCILRTGIVLSNKGGMLSKLLLPFRLGLGSVMGNGNQYLSWIHFNDMIDGIVYLLGNEETNGVFNFAAPNPVTNKRFSNTFSSVLHRPRIFRIPRFALKMAMGESATMVIDGQRVIPSRLIDADYRFSYENIDDALKDLFPE